MAYRTIIIVASIALAVAFACGSDNKTKMDAPAGNGTDALTQMDAKVYLDAPGSGSGSGSGSGTMGVACGSATCNVGDTCCVGSGGTRTCTGSGSACMGISYSCQGAANCGSGETCCYHTGSGSGSAGATCDTGPCALPACGSAADCPNAGDMCCMLGSSGFNYCAAQCF